MTRRRTSWRQHRPIPHNFITQRELMDAAGIDAILFEQLRAQGIIPRNPPPWQWSGVPIWYRADQDKIAQAIAAELERRRQVASQIQNAGTTPAS